MSPLHVLARVSQRFALCASGAMPLFPIGELPTETVSSGDAIDESILRLAAPVVATTATSEEWLQVGQSYSNAAATDADGGTMIQHLCQDSPGTLTCSRQSQLLPTSKARRCTAADFFGDAETSGSVVSEGGLGARERSTINDVRDGSSTLGRAAKRGAGEESDEPARKTKRKKRSSSLSDEDADSGRDIPSRHRKIGEGNQRTRKNKHERREKQRSASRKSRRKTQSRGSSRRHKSRKNADDSTSDESSGQDMSSPRRRSNSAYSRGQQLFVEDRRADQENLSLGEFYRLDIPVYHGMNQATRRGGGQRRNGEAGKASRYFGNQARSVNGDGRLARVQLWRGDKRRDQALAWTHAGAPSQASATAVEQSTSDNDVGKNRQNARHQRRIESTDFLPVDPVTIPLDEQATRSDRPNEEDGVFSESVEQWVIRRTKEFNVMTREQPHAEKLWLQYADFQEEAARAVHGGGLSFQSPSAAHVRTTLEKRASVLDGALRRNPSSIKLRIAQLQLAEQLQEHDYVDSLWKKAIEKSNHCRPLWLQYLKFKAGHFASFSVPNQRSTYSRCIRDLDSKREQTRKAYENEQRAKGVFIMQGRSMLDDSKENAGAEKDMLDVLWSYCMMERAAGYAERALGTLQAMAELNIRSGSSILSMDELEAFWDSEAPRIGDAHPSLAGVAKWRENASAPSVKSPSQQPLGPGAGHAVATRKPTAVRAPRVRGRRKRAVDFFSDVSSLQTLDSVGPDRSPVRAETARDVGAMDQASGSKSNVAAKSDVLEQAYHAAMALSATPTAPANVASPADGAAAQIHLPQESRLDSESMLQEAAATVDASGLIAAQEQAKRAEYSSQEAEYGAVAEEAGKAVEAEGLIWVDDTQTTAYSVRHGYRIDVQGAKDSVSGLEYGRILNQMRGGEKEHTDRDVEASAASKRLRHRGARERVAELEKQAAVLEDVPDGDLFSGWAKSEDRMTRHQWQPLRATEDPEAAEEQPDRVVFVEDLRPLLFSLAQPTSIRILVGMLLSAGGLVFPRSGISHSPKVMSEACQAGSFGDGGLPGSLLSAVNDGLEAVWGASAADLPVSGKGVAVCSGRQKASLSPLAVSSAADQFVLLTNDVISDQSRQTFLRNVLHHLIRAPESLPTANAKPGAASESAVWSAQGGNTLVQLQCCLMMFEGYLAATAGARHSPTRASGGALGEACTPENGGGTPSNDDSHGLEARKVAKSLLEASNASATDLRLWSSYVQLLALLGNKEEAIKVAEKALSMVQALPEDKKPLSAELFWLTFRLHAGLSLSPRDGNADIASPSNKVDALASLFPQHDGTRNRTRDFALLVLCSFAEGSFKRSKTKKSKREGKKSRSDAAEVSPPRLLAARRLMAEHVARIAAAMLREGADGGVSDRPEGALDMTPPFMYYAVAWVWLEYLTRGQDEAEKAMTKCLTLANSTTKQTGACSADGVSATANENVSLGGTLAGNQRYSWSVVHEDSALGVCLERMHRAFSELLVLAQRYNPVATGPRRVRAVLLRGLQSFPAEPGMVCMLLDAEKFSGSQQRMVHHLYEVSRRRTLTWDQGPTPLEWVLTATHQVMGCVHEARQIANAPGAQVDSAQATEGDKQALRVKNWLPGSYSRLKRSMEAAVTHPTGRGIPLLWRLYMSLEAMRGNHIQAKHLFWRAIHACPGNKAVWMDALRGDQKSRMGAIGLRPAFRGKELTQILDALLEKSLHLRAAPP